MAVEIVEQTVRVSPVGKVSMTETVLDGDTGVYRRVLRFFGVPAEGDSTPPLLYTIELEGPDRLGLAITAPEHQI